MEKRQAELLDKCRVAMVNALTAALNGSGPYNNKESLLAYYDHAWFFGYDVVDSGYANTTAAINRLVSMPDAKLIKLHRGAGSWAHYTFEPEVVAGMIDDIKRKLNA